jgi:outer membrane lipoprotein LolB
MSRSPDRHVRYCAAWALTLLLAACATTPSSTPLDAVQQREALLRMPRFSFAGRVAVAPQGSGPANVEWQQRQEVAKVKLSGPFGAGALQLEYSPDSLRISTGRGDRLADEDAEQLLLRELGFLPPFDALRFWILGIAAPTAPATETRDAAGLLQAFSQQGWAVTYERYTAVDTRSGRMQLPAKLVASRDNLRLSLVIDRWNMK